MTKSDRRRILAFFLCVLLILAILPRISFRAVYPRKYSDIVSSCASLFDVPSYIVYAVIKTESNFNPEAISSAGAIGLMQIMPSTFLWLTELLGESYDAAALYDPVVNVRYGTYYLRYLYEYYGNYETAFAAYNAGMGNVSRWLSSKEYSKDGRLVAIPFPETDEYVRLVTRRAAQYQKFYKLKG